MGNRLLLHPGRSVQWTCDCCRNNVRSHCDGPPAHDLAHHAGCAFHVMLNLLRARSSFGNPDCCSLGAREEEAWKELNACRPQPLCVRMRSCSPSWILSTLCLMIRSLRC